jgi:hypothetical protein
LLLYYPYWMLPKGVCHPPEDEKMDSGSYSGRAARDVSRARRCYTAGVPKMTHPLQIMAEK